MNPIGVVFILNLIFKLTNMNTFNFGDGNRRTQVDLFGTWFSAHGSASYFVDKCSALIEKYEAWLQHTRQLLSEKKEEMLKAKDKEIREFLSRYTPEEIAAFQNGSGN